MLQIASNSSVAADLTKLKLAITRGTGKESKDSNWKWCFKMQYHLQQHRTLSFPPNQHRGSVKIFGSELKQINFGRNNMNIVHIKILLEKMWSKEIESYGKFLHLPPLSPHPPRRQHICLEWPKAENERRYCKFCNFAMQNFEFNVKKEFVDIFSFAGSS